MDIRNWPMNQIMQLPDQCFGRRWPIVISKFVDLSTKVWIMSECALPETCLIWEVFAFGAYTGLTESTVAFALGDAVPANEAQFDALEKLFSCWRIDGGDQSAVLVDYYGMTVRQRIRMPVTTSGLRMVVELNNAHTAAAMMAGGIVISSIPTEVPDCLLSGHP